MVGVGVMKKQVESEVSEKKTAPDGVDKINFAVFTIIIVQLMMKVIRSRVSYKEIRDVVNVGDVGVVTDAFK